MSERAVVPDQAVPGEAGRRTVLPTRDSVAVVLPGAGATAYHPGEPCPCGTTDCTGSKLSTKTGHVVGCICVSCRNRRNQKAGKRAQAKSHRNLDGQGFTPHHEESGLFYDLTVRPEVKTGAQVPALFRKFLLTDWFRRALSQSSRSIPVGIDARPAVCIDGRWLVVDLQRRELKK